LAQYGLGAAKKARRRDLLLPPKSSLNGKCWKLQNVFCRRRNSEDAASASSNSRSAFPNGFLSTLSLKQRDAVRKAQVARRKKLESRAEVVVIEIHVEDENDLIVKMKNIYDDLINSKPPIDAFYVIIVSLRAFFAKETWKDRVEESVRDLLKRCLLQPASKMADKYLQFETRVPLAKKIDEYKLQVFLHVYCIENDKETSLDENLLDTIISLLGIISLISDAKVLREFFEELFENFVDSVPRHLTRLYEDLNQPIPIELEQYSSLETEIPFYEPLVVPSPQKVDAAFCNPVLQTVKHSANTLSSIQQEADESDFEEGEDQSALSSTTSLSQSGSRTFRCSRSFMGPSKHHRLITVTSSGAKKLKLGRPAKIKSNNNDSAADNTNAELLCVNGLLSFFPGKGKANGQVNKLAPETPTFHQVRDSERKRRLMTKIASDPQIKRVIVQETPPKLWKARVPVRQSPRQHASTRALYSCAPRLVSQLVKFSSSMADGADIDRYDFDLNEFSDEHAADINANINGQSPNFVYLKSKASSCELQNLVV
uniref:Treslin N-terminal domain-containing protein n=1 Tax=Romanomermis culicivorax TaxID=13658 RepID=A0A915JAU0_ROMCU